MRFVIFPLAVDVLAMGDIDEGKSIYFILAPVRDVKGKIVVDEDAQSVSLLEAVHLPLVFTVTVVNSFVHFNNKNNISYLSLPNKIKRLANKGESDGYDKNKNGSLLVLEHMLYLSFELYSLHLLLPLRQPAHILAILHDVDQYLIDIVIFLHGLQQ